MSATLHERLVQRAVAGRYDLFLGVGGGLAVLGLILFIVALRAGQADRAWQLFHVNWLYFTGLAGGSVAFVAVQKITNAKWSGDDHPVRRGLGGVPAGLAARRWC